MIEDFFKHCANGIKIKDGDYVEDIFPELSPMEFFKPEYQTTHYSWVSSGTEYTRTKDKVETQVMKLTPNKKYFVVEQSAEKYGHDNVLILKPDGTEYLRLKNPYPNSDFFRPNAQYEFYETRVTADKVIAIITASWPVPKWGGNAEPMYSVSYDDDTWEHGPLEFITSKAY